MPDTDLSADLAGLPLEYFWMNGSGPLATPASMALVSGYKIGAVKAKDINWEGKAGYDTPVLTEEEAGMINAVGLSNPGIIEFCRYMREQGTEAFKRPVILGVFSEKSPEDAAATAGYMEDNIGGMFQGLKLNVSCRHTDVGLIGKDPQMTADYTGAVRKATEKPLMVKLTADCEDIGAIAGAAVDSGADIISLINTIPSYPIDARTGKKILTSGMGGLSGPPLKPIGFRKLREVYEAVGDKVKIVYGGGITTPRDAIEAVELGAHAVTITTELFKDRPRGEVSRGDGILTVPEWLSRFEDGVVSLLDGLGVKGIGQIRGIAYE